jgi:hypothetical protein
MTYISTGHSNICEIICKAEFWQFFYSIRSKKGHAYHIDREMVRESLGTGYGFVIEAIEELGL